MVEVTLEEAHVKRLKRPVGTIMLYWGLIDVMITHIANLMFQTLKTPELSHSVPTPFSGRVDIIKKNLKRHTEFASVKEPTLQALVALGEVKELREILVHGTAVAYESENDAIIFSRIDRLKNKQKLRSDSASHQFGRMHVRFKTLEDAASRCLELQEFFAPLLDRLEAP